MTFTDHYKKYLDNQGMFPEDIAAVIDKCKAHPTLFPGDLWDKSVEGYPSAIMVTMTMAVRRVALEWIEANAPEAWYKPLFVD